MRAAFFDLDDTLIAGTSMFRFLAHLTAATGRPDVRLVRATLAAMAAAGVPRQERNRAFHAFLRGAAAAELAAHGQDWFAAELATGRLFNPAVLDRLRAHQQAGVLTVLVSGSMPACVHPVADHVGVSTVVCTRPEVVAGRLTGAVGVPMIGPAKAVAARRVATDRGVRLAGSYAYGDHISDLPLLSLVGHPVVVGEDPALGGYARRHGWDRLPAAA